MKKTRLVCAALTLLIAGLTAAGLAAKPPGGGGGGGGLNCKGVLCALPDCGDGYHTETPAGQCCPVCVPN